MLFSKLLAMVEPTEIEKMLLEQKETLRQLDLIQLEVDKIKNHVPTPNTVKNMYDASNTPNTPIFDMSQNSLMIKAEKFFNGIDKVTHYLKHPILIVNAIAVGSYWVCLVVGLGGILFYVVGFKKGLKYTGGSLLVYTLIQAINCGLNLL